MVTDITVPQAELEMFCRRHGVHKLLLFGSVLRDDFTADSDVDVLVEFAPNAVAGLLDLARMEIELSELIGRKVDLRTPAELSRYFRDTVLAAAETLYVSG